MVGVLGLGNRHPPSRRADTSGSIANPKPVPPPARQTHPIPPDSTDNTSSGGLNFFSRPHWTRRILPVSSSARKSPAGLPNTDEYSANLFATSPRRLLLEKDLPPTPADANITTYEPTARRDDARVSISVQQVADTPPQPTLYLDAYHNTPMLSTPSQINSVAFTSFPNSSTEKVLRKTKSTFSLRPQQPSSSPEQQRARGVSLTQMFTTAKRAPTSPCITNGNSPSTPLVRKSSFWSRTFSASSSQRLAVPAESPSLPVLKPTSPLRVDFTSPPDTPARSHSNARAARPPRHHSERAVRHPPTARTNIPSLPHTPVAPDRTNVRPSTADPNFLVSHRSHMRRPATADSAALSRSRSRSLFALSQQSTVPPLSNQSSSDNPTPRFKIGSPNPRPRSSTNPPLLHRLSVNLFASSTAKSGPLVSNGVTLSPSFRSPRSSLSQIPPDTLKPRAGESSEAFVNRLVSLVSKADIAVVLASA